MCLSIQAGQSTIILKQKLSAKEQDSEKSLCKEPGSTHFRFVEHIGVTTQFCHFRVKAVIDNTNECGCTPIKLYLPNKVECQIWLKKCSSSTCAKKQ